MPWPLYSCWACPAHTPYMVSSQHRDCSTGHSIPQGLAHIRYSIKKMSLLLLLLFKALQLGPTSSFSLGIPPPLDSLKH